MTQTIYIPGDKIEIYGGHPDMDVGDYQTVAELLFCFASEGADENFVALAVKEDGRVYYHYTFGGGDTGGFSCDLFEYVSRMERETFEALIDEHALDITTVETANGDIYDVALNANTTLPHGAELYKTGRFA